MNHQDLPSIDTPIVTTAVAEPPKPAKACAAGVADQLAQRQTELHEGAEQILRDLAEDLRAVASNSSIEDQRALVYRMIRSIDPMLQSVFTSLGWDENRVTTEAWRIIAVVDSQRVAGTAAELAAAQKTLADARAVLATEGAAIDEQLAALEAKKRELLQAVRLAERPVETMTNARNRLREKVPQHITKRISQFKACVHSGVGHAKATVEARITTIRSVLELTDREQIARHCHALPAGHPAKTRLVPSAQAPGATTHCREVVDDNAFESYKRELRAELPKLEREFADLQAQFDSEITAAQSLADYYIDQLG